jgi:hypothetical protein
MPATAATSTIPRPIMPQPTTANFVIADSPVLDSPKSELCIAQGVRPDQPSE